MAKLNWARQRQRNVIAKRGIDSMSYFAPLPGQRRAPGRLQVIPLRCSACGHSGKVRLPPDAPLPRFRCSRCGARQ